jgi:hypothetical protein
VRLLALALVACMGCATELSVTQKRDACSVRGTINTGTTIVCGQGGVAVERASVKETASIILPSLIQAILFGR